MSIFHFAKYCSAIYVVFHDTATMYSITRSIVHANFKALGKIIPLYRVLDHALDTGARGRKIAVVMRGMQNAGDRVTRNSCLCSNASKCRNRRSG